MSYSGFIFLEFTMHLQSVFPPGSPEFLGTWEKFELKTKEDATISGIVPEPEGLTQAPYKNQREHQAGSS